MSSTSIDVFSELVRASARLSDEHEFRPLASVLVEQALDITRSDIAALYGYPESGDTLRLVYRRGRGELPKTLDRKSEVVEFLEDCRETLVITRPGLPFFSGAMIADGMQSAVVVPLFTPTDRIGVIVLNSRRADFYGRHRFQFLDSFCRLAAGMLHNSQLFQEIKEQLRIIEEQERYQTNIFESMTNLLVTTDPEGRIRRVNSAASVRLGIGEDDMGRPFAEVVGNGLSENVRSLIAQSEKERRLLMGIEGIYAGEKDIDFSLNVSPLIGPRKRYEGLTFLFTDQSRERELKEQMHMVVEERRQMKDMLARRLSAEVVEQMMSNPDAVRLGGGKKEATVLFGDIRGYTSFSEGKSPEFIIEILNAYFNVAVEIVIRNRGFIDKFIGDAIMAEWGVPMMSREQDAINAVTAAWEIQQAVADENRIFFRGEAEHLRIGIGMNSGTLVAGNLGGERRMDYSVIGDTVNVAARLEGVAKGGEVVITNVTRDLLGDSFKLEELEPVKVKGKEKPLHIFKVLHPR